LSDKGSIVFCGTPDFAVSSLNSLIDSGYNIELVITQPDKPKGRGRKLAEPPVKQAALQAGLPVLQTGRLRQETELIERLTEIAPDFLVVVAFGQLIPSEILAIPKLGTINVHASLLPKYRGANPIARSIYNGDRVTGVTTMLLDEGMDTGPMLQKRELAIKPGENSGELRERLAVIGSALLIETLEGMWDGSIKPEPQDDAKATSADKFDKSETIIDWSRPATELAARIRALAPTPGSLTVLPDGRKLKIYDVEVVEGSGSTGQVVACKGKMLDIATGEGALRLVDVQCEGKKRMRSDAFLCGATLCEGENFK
jgi:methionyl-tRNA formyltransferase